MRTAALVLSLAVYVSAVTRDHFYPHGPNLDVQLPRGAEVSSPEIPLNVPIVLFGETYETVYVSNYGVLSFRAVIPTFLNAEFPLPYPSIAAFYANIDTTELGAVYYRETNESYVILKAEESVQNNIQEYYDFKPTSVFLATWIDVTYTRQHIQDKKTSFQIAVISNGTESFVEFLYPESEIQWIQKETPPGSLPNAKVQAGFVAKDGRLFTLIGSGSHQRRNIVSCSNTQEYVFRVGDSSPASLVAVPDEYGESEVDVAKESKTCAQSGPSVCHLQAQCINYQSGICCRCNEGFFGNGKTCIQDDVPIRIHGKLNGIINNVNLTDVDIQANVVVADGRSYTALSQAPSSLGGSLQLLNILGGVIGWLFAKPSGAALNGYQLTGGVFNHSADIFFPATGDRVIINQEYAGQDVFDQLAVDTDIRGTIPDINPGSRLEVSEYEEQYTSVEAGVIHSASERTFTNKITGQKYEQRISQTILYSPCKFAPISEDNRHFTLKAYKNDLAYEPKEHIVRYVTSSKIKSIGQKDYVKGYKPCGRTSTCVVQVKCSSNTDCPPNAICSFSTASYLSYDQEQGQCVCPEGYVGDAHECTERLAPSCSCGPNAHCADTAAGELICVCDFGYHSDGYLCRPNFSCNNNSDCKYKAECRPEVDTDEYICQCIDGYIKDQSDACIPDTQLCNGATCAEHASCLFDVTNQVSFCHCDEGYKGEGFVSCLSQKRTLKKRASEIHPRKAFNYLVVSDGASVYWVPLTISATDVVTPLNSAIDQRAAGIHVDCLTRETFWGDISARAIKRISYDGFGFEEFLSNDVGWAEGVAIDWEAKNIFWTDSWKLTIEVANIDTKVRKVLFKKDDISNPRGIVVHPRKGKIFWSDWNRSAPKIEWANMDGSQRSIFLDKADVALPNSLAIDWSTNNLCYSDAGLLAIKCVNIDTLEKQTIAENCSYPFGLAISGDKFFWTDWHTKKIEYVDNSNKVRGYLPLTAASGRFYGITTVPERCPDQRNVCRYRSGNCEVGQLCLPNGQDGRSCVNGD